MTLNQGDVIQIAGVYGVNPQNRQNYGKLRNFVVTATTAVATGGGTSVIVSPAIITGGQFQNVVVTATSSTAVVTPFNNTGTVSPQQHLASSSTEECVALGHRLLCSGNPIVTIVAFH